MHSFFFVSNDVIILLSYYYFYGAAVGINFSKNIVRTKEFQYTVEVEQITNSHMKKRRKKKTGSCSLNTYNVYSSTMATPPS